ncbi:MAG: cupin domain-containing protein [Candidatus Zixiibacteriota bacterium]|nr:MAG: cupin domain-containing protein [candidate division Zixibacteria bacterium]
MPVIKSTDIEMSDIKMDGAEGMQGLSVISKDQGWDTHNMRLFRLLSGGNSPRHSHDWEHVNYITTGRGRLRLGEDIKELAAGDFAFVPPNMEHQYSNPYDEPFEFICIVPLQES